MGKWRVAGWAGGRWRWNAKSERKGDRLLDGSGLAIYSHFFTPQQHVQGDKNTKHNSNKTKQNKTKQKEGWQKIDRNYAFCHNNKTTKRSYRSALVLTKPALLKKARWISHDALVEQQQSRFSPPPPKEEWLPEECRLREALVHSKPVLADSMVRQK